MKKKDRNKNALEEAKKRQKSLTAGQIQLKREFLTMQRNYRTTHRQRLYDGAKLAAIREEIAYKEKHSEYESKMTWEGLPYTQPMLVIIHDIVQDEYYNNLEQETYFRLRLINRYGFSNEQADKTLISKDSEFLKESPKLNDGKLDKEEKKEDYFG